MSPPFDRTPHSRFETGGQEPRRRAFRRIASAVRAVPLTVLLLCALPAAPSHAQVDPDAFSIAGTRSAGAGSVARDFGDLMGLTMVATAQIEDARRRFWETYPDKPGFEEASARFAELLWQKDQMYMMGFLIEGPPLYYDYEPTPNIFDILAGRAARLPPGQRNLAEALLGLVGGIDGGIDPDLNRWFFEWVRAVRRGMGVTNDRELLIFNPLRYPGALAQAQEEYQAYVRIRDRKELWNGPFSPLRSDNPQHVLAGAFARGGELSFEAAQERVRLLEQFAGPEAVWYLYEMGTVGSRIGLTTVTYRFRDLRPFVGHGRFVPDTPRGWLASMFMPTSFEELPDQIAQVQALFDEYGEERVWHAVERLRSVGLHFGQEFLADYSGHPMQTPGWWFERLLDDPDTQLPTITEPIVIDARDAALLEEAAARQLSVRIVGTVTHATWHWSPDAPRRGGDRHPSYGWLQLHMEGADHLQVATRCCASGPYMFTGFDGELVVSRRIAVYSKPTPRADGGLLVQLYGTPGMIEVVDDTVQPVRALPAGVIDRPNEDRADGDAGTRGEGRRW